MVNVAKFRADAYLDYSFLKLLLKPLSKLVKKNIHITIDKDRHLEVTNMNANFINNI